MPTRSPGSLVLLIPLVAFLNACSNNETPTEPRFPSGVGGTLHLVGINASSGDLGLWKYTPPLTNAVRVPPGGSSEMSRCNTRLAAAPFIVFQPFDDSRPLFRAIATVNYKVLSVPAWPYDEMTATVRISLDAAGAVTVVSDRPDVVQIVSVTLQ